MVVFNAARFLAKNAKIRNKLKEMGEDIVEKVKKDTGKTISKTKVNNKAKTVLNKVVKDKVKDKGKDVKVTVLPPGTFKDFQAKMRDEFKYAPQSKKVGRERLKKSKKTKESETDFEARLDKLAKQGGVTSYKESQKGKQYVTESGRTGRYPKAKDVTADQAADEMGISGRKNQKIDTALFTRKGLADAGMEEVQGKVGGLVKKLKKSKNKRSYRGYGAARKG
tara:strand:- start:410 stop:1078 length:669 start_codon:yes stop_codon:yes gene_type:complete